MKSLLIILLVLSISFGYSQQYNGNISISSAVIAPGPPLPDGKGEISFLVAYNSGDVPARALNGWAFAGETIADDPLKVSFTLNGIEPDGNPLTVVTFDAGSEGDNSVSYNASSKTYTITQTTAISSGGGYRVRVKIIHTRATLADENGFNANVSVPTYLVDPLPSDNNASTFTSAPVLLSSPSYSFNGSSLNCSNELKWNTTNDSKTRTFDVEKSETGASFTKVQNVAAKSIVNGVNSYSYTDNNINAGNQYYRLKFTDITGNITYSNIIRLSNSCNLPKVSIFPNPVLVYQEATILLQNFSAKATGVLYDATGKQMGVIKLQNGTNRFNAIRFDAGTYTLKVNDEAGNASVLRILIKR